MRSRHSSTSSLCFRKIERRTIFLAAIRHSSRASILHPVGPTRKARSFHSRPSRSPTAMTSATATRPSNWRCRARTWCAFNRNTAAKCRPIRNSNMPTIPPGRCSPISTLPSTTVFRTVCSRPTRARVFRRINSSSAAHRRPARTARYSPRRTWARATLAPAALRQPTRRST